MKVAIVLATYNPNWSFLEQQVASLEAQSLTDWHCYVSDESTKDDLRLRLQQYFSTKPRFTLINNDNPGLGVMYNFENALKRVPQNTDFVCCCDQDDVWNPQKLELMATYLEQHPRHNLVHSDLMLIDKENQPLADSCWKVEARNPCPSTLSALLIRNVVTGCAMMFRRTLLDVALPFPPQIKGEYLHDHWIAVVAMAGGQQLGTMEIPLTLYRQHEQNVIGAQKTKKRSLFQKLTNLSSLKTRGLRAVSSRAKLASDLRNRLSTQEIPEFERSVKPILDCSFRYYFIYFISSLGKRFEFTWSVQLLAGSIFNKFC